MSELLAQLNALRAVWLDEEPRRAAGGVAALSGFHFQLLTTLRDRILAWDALPAADRSEPAVFDELLSDAVSMGVDGKVTITQAKKVLSSDGLAKALDELWSIDCLARRHTPTLAPRLAYRIRTSRSALRDVATAITRWVPKEGAEDFTALDLFRMGVEAEVLADPLEEVLAALVNSFNPADPLGLVRRWIGLLLERVGGGGAQQAAIEIWNDLRTLQSTAEAPRAPVVLQWSGEWLPPAVVAPGGYLTGERPTVLHLREGYFAPRDGVYGAIADQATEWIAEMRRIRSHTRLPVFWIGGRSGTGKSVALLHVLALLHEREQGPVFWLGNKMGLLPVALARARALRMRESPAIIGIDDPYSADGQVDAAAVWRESLEQIESSRQVSGSMDIPLIVCCGPTEHAEHLIGELPDDIHLTRAEVPQESAADIGAMRTWFRLRTGFEPPDVSDDNLLLVQVFFEWRVQATLPEFAARLKNRIRSNGRDGEAVLEFLSVLLALNRLYVGLPSAAQELELTAKQQDLLEFLRRDNHLAESTHGGQTELWLAHPHLSNAIYESWYPARKNRAKRREHVRNGIRLTLRHGSNPANKTAPLWAFSQALRAKSVGEGDVADRIDTDSLPRLLADVHGDFGAEVGGPLPLWALPVWVALCAGCPAVAISPDPVDRAIGELRRENLNRPSLRLICHVLLRNTPAFDTTRTQRILEGVYSLLLAGVSSWTDWARVWVALFTRISTSAVGVPRVSNITGQLLELALRWMERHPDHQQLQAVWDRVQGHPATAERLTQVGCRVLTSLSSDPPESWPYLWQKAWRLTNRRTVEGPVPVETQELRSQLYALALTWLPGAFSHAAWGYVWKQLWIGRPRPELAERALEWLSLDNDDRAGQNVVLAEFSKMGAVEPELRDVLSHWLNSAEHRHPAWGVVWLMLGDQAGSELAERAVNWLDAVPPPGDGIRWTTWQMVWQRLWARPELRPKISSVVAERLKWLGTTQGELSARVTKMVMEAVLISPWPIQLPRMWRRVHRIRGIARTGCLGRGSFEGLLSELDLPGVELSMSPSPGFLYAPALHNPPSDSKQTDFPAQVTAVVEEFVLTSSAPVLLGTVTEHVKSVLGLEVVEPAWGGYGSLTKVLRSTPQIRLRITMVGPGYVYIPGVHARPTYDRVAGLRGPATLGGRRLPNWTPVQYAEYFRTLAVLLPLQRFDISQLTSALREALHKRGVILSRNKMSQIAMELSVAGYNFLAAGAHDPLELAKVFIDLLRHEAEASKGDVTVVNEWCESILRAMDSGSRGTGNL